MSEKKTSTSNGTHWITIKGTPVMVDEEGKPKERSKAVAGRQTSDHTFDNKQHIPLLCFADHDESIQESYTKSNYQQSTLPTHNISKHSCNIKETGTRGKARTSHLNYDLFLDSQRQKKSPDSGAGQNQRLTGDATSNDVVSQSINIHTHCVNIPMFTFDASSSRSKDENGFLHVSSSHISKETVNPYYGVEIPHYKEQGLDPNEIYYGYRKGSELAKGAKTFNGLPLLLGHYAESAETPQIEHRVGSLGTDACFTTPYLDNSLIITDAKAIASIENGTTRQISCAYRYDPVFVKGEFQGQSYDFIMTNIRGNHAALVEEGRAGPDVAVADAALQKISPSLQQAEKTNPKQGNEDELSKTSSILAKEDRQNNINPQKGKTCMGKTKNLAVKLLQKLEITADEANPQVEEAAENLVEAVGEKNIEQLLDQNQSIEEKANAVLNDEDLSDEEKAKTVEDDETKPGDSIDDLMRQANLDPKDEKIKAAFAAGLKATKLSSDEDPENKCTADEDTEEKKATESEDDTKDKPLTAQDAALIRKQAKQEATVETKNHIKNLAEAARTVRDLCGEVDPFAFDSAAAIYHHALKSTGHSPTTKDIAALKDMVIMAKDAKRPVHLPPKKSLPTDGHFKHLSSISIHPQ